MCGLDYEEIVLHAGIHKTGTSYLQRLLSENRHVLASQSIHYPTYRGLLQHDGNHSSAIVGSAREEKTYEALRDRLTLESKHQRILLSAEEMSREAFSSKILLGLKSRFPGSHFRVIIYLRRFDHLIESVYAESVKNTLVGDIDKASYQLDFRKTLAPFERVLGRDCISIRPYSRSHWPNGSLLEDFLSCIRESEISDDFRAQPEVNVSLSRQETYLLSITSPGPLKKAAMGVLRGGRYKSENDGSRFFRSPEVRTRFVLAHRHILAELANRYALGDPDGLFGLKDFEDDPLWQPFVPDPAVVAAFQNDVQRQWDKVSPPAERDVDVHSSLSQT